MRIDSRGKRVLALVVAIGAIGAFAVSAAYFSSTDSTDFDQLAAGTIEISTDGSGSWSGNYDNLLPGASVDSDITVMNDGSAALAYAIAGTASADTAGFTEALQLKIYSGTCDDLGALLVTDTFDNFDGSDIIGNSDPYSDAGDRYLAAGDSDDLCAHVTFLNDGDQNDLQGATADLTLDFNATQIDADGSVASPAP